MRIFTYIQKNKVTKEDSLALQKHYLKTYAGHDVEVIREHGKKPYVADKSFYFNVSHSQNVFVMICASYEVGIDVEIIRPIDYMSMSKKFFMPEEHIKTLEEFYMTWCKKEATVKYFGQGNLKTCLVDSPLTYEIFYLAHNIMGSYVR